jgi:uncharacterized membrane protein
MPDDFWPKFWLNYAVMFPVFVAGPFLVRAFDLWLAVVLLAVLAGAWGLAVGLVSASLARRKNKRRGDVSR